MLGVHGSREGLPQLPDGEFREPRPMTPAERVFRERVERVFPERRVIISRGLNAGRPRRSRARRTRASPAPRPRSARPRRPAGSRCGARRSSPGCWWTATARGPPGWSSWTRSPGKTDGARAKVVFLCASTLESVRILMNSTSTAHPRGDRRGLGRARALRDGPQRGQRLLLPAGRGGRGRALSAARLRQHHDSSLPEPRRHAGAVPPRLRAVGRNPAAAGPRLPPAAQGRGLGIPLRALGDASPPRQPHRARPRAHRRLGHPRRAHRLRVEGRGPGAGSRRAAGGAGDRRGRRRRLHRGDGALPHPAGHRPHPQDAEGVDPVHARDVRARGRRSADGHRPERLGARPMGPGLGRARTST